MTNSSEFQARLQSVRGHYHVSPWLQPAQDEAPLLRSWQRCRHAGMREGERVSFELVSRSLLAELDDHHGALLQTARPEAQRLAHALRGTGCAVLLFNSRGVVIDRLCHEAAAPTALLNATRKGINVAERCVGTTAPAISLAEGVPYLVGRDAHFFANLRPYFCMAAPIDSPGGERLGALDITAYDSVPPFDVHSLVVDAAAAIENRLFTATPDRLVVHFHPRAELVDTSMEGLLLVDPQGWVCGANRVAARLLCKPRASLLGRDFTSLFDRRLQPLFHRSLRQRADLMEMGTHLGLQVMARFEGESIPDPVPPASRAQFGLHLAEAAADPSAEPPAEPTRMRDLERQAIERALAALGGNVAATARRLGISRNTIYRRRNARD
jgi:sigma-54 dependent transcriptional regulator, acetoin dehydrogenase operon transcriptional activator AcoR